jgi:hypothetical protein
MNLSDEFLKFLWLLLNSGLFAQDFPAFFIFTNQ